jgi:hypothetical protein
VDLNQVQAVGLQAFKALLHAAQRAIVCPVAGLRGEEHLFAATRNDRAIVGFGLAIVVGRRGVEVGDA